MQNWRIERKEIDGINFSDFSDGFRVSILAGSDRTSVLELPGTNRCDNGQLVPVI